MASRWWRRSATFRVEQGYRRALRTAFSMAFHNWPRVLASFARHSQVTRAIGESRSCDDRERTVYLSAVQMLCRKLPRTRANASRVWSYLRRLRVGAFG